MYKNKTIGDILRGMRDRAAYNYGEDSPITAACAAADPVAFMHATRGVTEMTDASLASVQNVIIARGIKW
jgi:hypothetical protein